MTNMNPLMGRTQWVHKRYSEFPEARQPRDGIRTESPVTVDEPPYSQEEHIQIWWTFSISIQRSHRFGKAWPPTSGGDVALVGLSL